MKATDVKCIGDSCSADGKACVGCSYTACAMTDSSCNCESGICIACDTGEYCYKGKCFTKSTTSGTTGVQTDTGTQGETDDLKGEENEVPEDVVEDELKDTAGNWIYIVVIALILSGIGGFMFMRMRPVQSQAPAQLPPQLYQWVDYYRSGGMNDDQIRVTFMKSGYTPEQIDQLLKK
jgi:hypothetical protein